MSARETASVEALSRRHVIEGSSVEVDAAARTAPLAVVISDPLAGGHVINGTDDPDTLNGLDGNDTLNGLGDDDTLNGGDGNDTLNGGSGGDTMTGGKGNDIYVVDSANDTVFEATGQGIDTIQSSVTINLAASFVGQEIENVTLLNGAGGLAIFGNALNNVLTGNDGANQISGGDGNDTIIAGGSEDGNTLFGEAGNDTITSGAGADRLDGGAGNDTMTGGGGNDNYVVDSIGDKVIETLAGTGDGFIDTVEANITFSIAALANIEIISIFGATQFENLNATGNAANNTLDGNFGDNILDGGKGDDILIGRGGNDTYILDSAVEDNSANVVEQVDDGTDTAKISLAAIDTAIDNVENYIFTGTTTWDFDGNELDNVITGGAKNDVLDGGDGNDTLIGGAGADQMTGGLGNDTFFIDNVGDTVFEAGAGGRDRIVTTFSTDLTAGALLNQEIEDLTLLGTAIKGTGTGAANNIIGNDAANILDGAGGADQLVGGKGDDTYFFDDPNDELFELAGEGKDTLNTKVDIDFSGFALNRNIENFVLLAGATGTTIRGNDIDNTITGNVDNNTLIGGGGNDTIDGGKGNDTLEGGTGNDKLIGGEGNDSLDGGLGDDTLTGGAGNDRYFVDSAKDIIVETAVGKGDGFDDEVIASVTYSIAAFANIEVLNQQGATGDVNGTGNALGNTLLGSAGNNTLDGGAGNDFLSGGNGNDTLIGGTGNDSFVGGDGDDTFILDNVAEVDFITENSNEGADTLKTAAFAITQEMVDKANLVNVENFVYTGSTALILDLTGTGDRDGQNNTLVGGSGADKLTDKEGNNFLDGGAGADTLVGGFGDDTYVVDNLGDKINDENGAGGTNDTLIINRSIDLLTKINVNDQQFIDQGIENITLSGTAALNAFGNDIANILTGNTGANILDGKIGADTLAGGKGDDTYFFDDANDVLVELANEGKDTLKTLVDVDFSGASTTRNIENFILLEGATGDTIRGNEFDNTITGNTKDNDLLGFDGNDIIDGGNGNDELDGGNGNDKLTGGAGDDTLIGGDGINTLTGGTGNDTYFVSNTKDIIVETGNNAIDNDDVVVSSATFSIASLANIEQLVLSASIGDTNGTGNARDNRILGNNTNNILDGGGGNDFLQGNDGNDTLIGGAGNDEFEGGADNDIMIGGAGIDRYEGGDGDDTYDLDNIAELQFIVEDANEGSDTLKTGAFAISTNLINITANLANFENFIYTGAAKIDINLDDTALGGGDNILVGGSGADKLQDKSGNNFLDGGAGADTLIGGGDNDTYVIDNIGDTIDDNGGSGDTILINRSISLDSAINKADQQFINEGIENITLTGTAALNATGNSFIDNVLVGNIAANTLDGFGGADTLIGGKGNDIYILHGDGETIVENANEGIDTIKSDFTVDLSLSGMENIENVTVFTPTTGAVIFVGNDLGNILTGGTGDDNLDGGNGNDTLTGGAGNDILDGGAGNDTMTGGAGNDVYIVDSLGDKVIETLTNATGGRDELRSSITYSIAALANIDDLTLTGSTGNSSDTDAINATGNANVNVLNGNDGNNVLDGGKGVDFFFGGGGDDTYVLDDINEFDTNQISDSAGIDTIKSGVLFDEGDVFFLANEIENFTYTGALSWVFNITGASGDHVLTGGSGADVITGGNGLDTLDGGLGADTMKGGSDDTRYVVDNIGDKIDDSGGSFDSVSINRSVDLLTDFGGQIESAELTGKAAIDANGNFNDNFLIGNDGNNKINGGGGSDLVFGGGGDDVLTGGSDQDRFDYNQLSERGTGKEVITDFSVTDGDILDIHDLLVNDLGYGGTDPFADHFVAFVDDGKGNTIVQIDADGDGTAKGFVTLVTLQNAHLTENDTANFFI